MVSLLIEVHPATYKVLSWKVKYESDQGFNNL